MSGLNGLNELKEAIKAVQENDDMTEHELNEINEMLNKEGPLSPAPLDERERRLVTVGIDPGATGAVVVLVGGRYSFVDDLAGTSLDAVANLYLRVTCHLEAHGLQYHRGLVVIERQQYIPKGGKAQGGVSAFNLGVNYGMTMAFSSMLGYESVAVAPQTWQKYVYGGVTGGTDGRDTKKRSLARAAQLLPDLPLVPDSMNRRAPRHGRSDAGLIALYGHALLRQRIARGE